MKKLLVGIALAAGLIDPVVAQDTPAPTLDAIVRVTDKYSASRGFLPSSQSSAQPAFNLNIPVGKGVASAEYWANLPLYKQGFPEHDVGFFYTSPLGTAKRIGPVEGRVGWQSFKDDFELYQEFQAVAKVKNPKLLNPSLFFAHDYSKAGHGRYIEPSISASTPKLPLVHERADVTLAGMYNDHYVLSTSGWSGFKTQAELPVIRAEDGTTVTMDVKYFRSTCPQLRSHWAGGVSVKRSFDAAKAYGKITRLFR